MSEKGASSLFVEQSIKISFTTTFFISSAAPSSCC